MKNKIKKMKKFTLIITILILSVIFLSGTFARYASSASGTDSTMVAKWSFEVNGKDITVLGDDEIVSFDLFDTIYDSDGESKETDVKEGMIAPGTAGAFEFYLNNTSEVTTSYELGINVSNENIPLEFSFDGETWLNEMDTFVSTDTLGIGDTKNIVIKWQWPFEADKVTDSSIGGEQITVTADITAYQGGVSAKKYVEKPIFENITTHFTTTEIANGTSFKYDFSPFTHQNLDLYSGKTISKIGIPVKKVKSLSEKQYFTLSTVDKTLLASKKATNVINTYKIEVPLTGYTSETINDWVYIDLRKYDIKVGENETLAFTSSTDEIELSYYKATNKPAQYRFLTKITSQYGATNEGLFFDVYYLEEVKTQPVVEKQVFTDINKKFVDIASSNVANNSSGPFSYQSLNLFSGKKLSKIGIPVKSVEALDENQTFTLYVVEKNNLVNNQAAKVTATYELKLPKSQLGENTTVNKWIYVDLRKYNITVGENETLAFSSTTDTVKWGFANAQNSSLNFGSVYLFKTRVLTTPANVQSSEAIYFDIYYLEEEATEKTPTQIFQYILEEVPENKISTLSAWSYTSAPYTYTNSNYFANKTITKIGIPVKSVQAIDENQTFTVQVVNKNDVANKKAVTISKTYTLKLKKEDLGTNAAAVNKWIYVDTNITLSEDETIIFGKDGDTITAGYGNGIINADGYGFWGMVNSNSYSDNSSKELIFDIYAIDNDELANSLKTTLNGKNLSILGDSISTFKGYSNDSTNTNSTIGGNAIYYNGSNIITNVNDTWWMKTVGKTNLNLLVNNSWSGDTIASRGKTRAMQLHDDTGDNAGTTPDIIAVYLGINDIKNGATVADFTTNYNQMVSNIRTTYPNADVFLLTHIPYSYSSASRPTITDELLEEFNAAIRNAVSANEKCYLVDLYNDSGITQANHKTYMGDEGLHPNASGMEAISNTLVDALIERYIG